MRTLIFVRTRMDASEVAGRLMNDGFRAGALSGELAQAERTRMLDAFRKGSLAILVCTDVASRGIDVPEVARVIHAELPDNGEVLTHRSGRTGRAGRKGTSIMLVPTAQYRFAENLLRAANVCADLVPAPSARDVKKRRDARLLEELTASPDAAAEGLEQDPASDAESAEAPASKAKPRKLVQELIASLGAEAAIEALLSRLDAQGPCEPQMISEVMTDRPVHKPVSRPLPPRGRERPLPGSPRGPRNFAPHAQRR
jgi:ATP-dependent RNA helicase DeaD